MGNLRKTLGEFFRLESIFLELAFAKENDGFGGNEGTGDSGEDPSSAPDVDNEDVPDANEVGAT